MPWGCLLGEENLWQGLPSFHDFCHPGRGPSPGTREDRVSEYFFTIPVASADSLLQVPSPQHLFLSH